MLSELPPEFDILNILLYKLIICIKIAVKSTLRSVIMANKEGLFAGGPEPLGGLSNERELARICPDEFRKRNNPWHRYASKLFFEGGNIAHWKWKSDNEEERKRQLRCLQGVLAGFDLSHEDKEALAGWMLSEMLVEVPEYKPQIGD